MSSSSGSSSSCSSSVLELDSRIFCGDGDGEDGVSEGLQISRIQVTIKLKYSQGINNTKQAIAIRYPTRNMRAPIGEAPVGFLLSLWGYEICGCIMGRRRFSIKVAMSRKFFAMVGWRRKFGGLPTQTARLVSFSCFS